MNRTAYPVGYARFAGRRGRRNRTPIDFECINRAALAALPALLACWLLPGPIEGHEFVAQDPKRADRRCGRFSIPLASWQRKRRQAASW
jgi:hypothetical protein